MQSYYFDLSYSQLGIILWLVSPHFYLLAYTRENWLQQKKDSEANSDFLFLLSFTKTYISTVQSHYLYFIPSNPQYQPDSSATPKIFKTKPILFRVHHRDKKAVTFSCLHYDYTVFDMINCQEYIVAVLLKLF